MPTFLSYQPLFIWLVLFRLLLHVVMALHVCTLGQFVLPHVRINEHSYWSKSTKWKALPWKKEKYDCAKNFSAHSKVLLPNSTLWWGYIPKEVICANTHGAFQGRAHTSYFRTVWVRVTNSPAGYVITHHGNTEEPSIWIDFMLWNVRFQN